MPIHGNSCRRQKGAPGKNMAQIKKLLPKLRSILRECITLEEVYVDELSRICLKKNYFS